MNLSQIDPVHPCLVITVSREDIIRDTIASLSIHGSADLKKPLKVSLCVLNASPCVLNASQYVLKEGLCI